MYTGELLYILDNVAGALVIGLSANKVFAPPQKQFPQEKVT